MLRVKVPSVCAEWDGNRCYTLVPHTETAPKDFWKKYTDTTLLGNNCSNLKFVDCVHNRNLALCSNSNKITSKYGLQATVTPPEGYEAN